MKIPKAVEKLIASFERLPGIGPKTAQRLTFYLLHVPQRELDAFSEAVKQLKARTKVCSICFNVGEQDPCAICTDRGRDRSAICVVEEPLDVAALERSDGFHGLYHVLHGRIEPLRNIGPEELHINDLLPRLENGSISEIILATNPTMEGEATAMYIAKLIKENKSPHFNLKSLKITRIGSGLPVGGDLEYADDVTLARALEGRREF
ncbi:recombination protein RecR [Patescibacteria group bacterium]|nr:recombination protein RecR [Patescibacteria group bacterium]